MASDAAVRTRILTHMNKDHIYDSKLYLIHYLHYPKTLLMPSSTLKVLLSDIQNTHISIDVDDRTEEIPFDPPMSSLADSRVRLVEMTRAAEAALSVDRDTVDAKVTYLPPSTPGEIGFTLSMVVVGYMLLFPSVLQPGGLYYETVLKNYPQLAELMYKGIPVGASIYVGIHALEALWFTWFELGRYWKVPGVDPLTAGLWIADCLFQGYPAIRRWKIMLKNQKKGKGGKKDH